MIETNQEAPADLIQKTATMRAPIKNVSLDNLIIRDATEEEKTQLANLAKALVDKMVDEEVSDMTGHRCSIIQMTPRDSIMNTNREDLQCSSSRSDQVPLSGIKPKAL